MMSFQQFFNENRPGEKKLGGEKNLFKGSRTYSNGKNQQHNMTYDVNRVDPDESANTMDNIMSGSTTSKVVTPDLLQHIQQTYRVDLSNLSQPKTLGNSNVEIYSVRGANGQPIIMLRRKS
jgi:hypothetical protein